MKGKTDFRFRCMRWAWFALASASGACYIVQLCMRTIIIGADRRPRRVQTHEAGQEDETVVSDEEGGDEDEGVQDGNAQGELM